MSDNINIANAVKVISDSTARVAFELMKEIAFHEIHQEAEKETRQYWLTLFHQCMKATSSHTNLETILKKE